MALKQIEKITLTKHLAVMIKAGVTISEALDNLADQSSSGEVKKTLLKVKQKVDNGSSFHDALAADRKDFDDMYLGIIKVGESTGNLDDSLAYLADQLGKDYALKKRIKGAMMYPILVVIAVLVLAAFLSLFILPKLVDFFSAFDTKLPLSTRLLLGLANFMKSYGILFFGGIFALIILMVFLSRIPFIKLWIDGQILKVPFIGHLLIEREVATFARNLSTLIKSGLPIFEGLEICWSSQVNLEYKRTIKKLSESLEKGVNTVSYTHLRRRRCTRIVLLAR